MVSRRCSTLSSRSSRRRWNGTTRRSTSQSTRSTVTYVLHSASVIPAPGEHTCVTVVRTYKTNLSFSEKFGNYNEHPTYNVDHWSFGSAHIKDTFATHEVSTQRSCAYSQVTPYSLKSCLTVPVQFFLSLPAFHFAACDYLSPPVHD